MTTLVPIDEQTHSIINSNGYGNGNGYGDGNGYGNGNGYGY